MNALSRVFTTLLLLLFAFAAQAGEIVVKVRPGAKDVPLALPRPQVTGASAETAQEIWSVIQRDLEMTGYFNIIDPAAYIEQNKGVEPGTFDYADWRILKAAALAKTRISSKSNGLRADVFIYDVNVGAKLDAKAFAGKSNDARYLGHRIADAILLALTGEPGFFGTRLSAVGNQTGRKEIYVLDVDGAGITPVTQNQTINLSPAWSPSRDRIAFTSYKRNDADLYVKHLATGRVTPVSARAGMDSGATFSPDGKKIALTRSENGDTDIFVIDADTGAELQRVTRGGGIDVAPDWSPDGSKLVFASERSGGQHIYVANLATGALTRLTFQGSMNSDPVFSPDGSKIAFVGRDGRFDVFVMDADGKNLQRVTQGQGDNEDPSFSPDSRYLLFSSTRGGRSDIWLSTVDGRHQIRVTSGGGWTQPAWTP